MRIAWGLALLVGCGGDGNADSGSGTGPLCMGGACAAVIPSDWEGPAIVADAADASSLPTCDAVGAQELALAGTLTGEPADCDCSCEATGCTATLDFATDGQCSGGTPATLLPQVCTAVPVGSLSAAAAATGTCTPSEGSTVPPPSGGPALRVCGTTASSQACGEEGTCVPTPAGFRTAVCVIRTGEHDCPEAYPEREVAASYTDDRSCSACECPTGAASCTGTISRFTDAECTSVTPGVAPPAEGCIDLADAGGVSFSPTGGCPPSGGEPTGALTPSGMLTICCA